MRNKTVFIIFLILSIIIIVGSSVLYGLYLVDIEDHYGDAQNIHFKVQDDDIIFDSKSKKYGVIKKTLLKSSVISNTQNHDLYTWIYDESNLENITVYRPNNDIDISKLDDLYVHSLLEIGELSFVYY